VYIGYRKNKLKNYVILTYHGFEIFNQLSSYLFSFHLRGLNLYLESLNSVKLDNDLYTKCRNMCLRSKIRNLL